MEDPSRDAKIAMLLYCRFDGTEAAFQPLSHDEYNLLVSHLVKLKLGLSNLYKGKTPNIELLKQIEQLTLDCTGIDGHAEKDAFTGERIQILTGVKSCCLKADRLHGLLGRVKSLKQFVERLKASGIRVAGRRDTDFPLNFQRRLGRLKPVLFYYKGAQSLLAKSCVIIMGMKASAQYRPVIRRIVSEMSLPIMTFPTVSESTCLKTLLDSGGDCVCFVPGDLNLTEIGLVERRGMASGHLLFCSTIEPFVSPSQGDIASAVYYGQQGLSEYLVEFGVSPSDQEMVAPGYVSNDTVDGSGCVWGCPTPLASFSSVSAAFERMSTEPWDDNDGPCYRAGVTADFKLEKWQKSLKPLLTNVRKAAEARRSTVRYYSGSDMTRSFNKIRPFAADPDDGVRLEVAKCLGKVAHCIIATGEAVGLLLSKALSDPSEDVRLAALGALARYEGRAYLRRNVLEKIALDDRQPVRVREEARRTIATLDAFKEQETASLPSIEFQKQFNHELVCGDENQSRYLSFVNLCKARLPMDATERYQRLRTSGFVMKDDSDIDVYTVRVAGRHVEKFDWFYRQLFEVFKYEMTSRIDVVVWGCGCGLDLLALYDQALRQKNPDFWLVVNSVTLVDVSAPALNRARRIAEVLFPSARGRINVKQVDLKHLEPCQSIELPESFPYIPRLHLISNLLDLFDDVLPFARMLRESSWRHLGGSDGRIIERCVNDIYFVFSPEYRGGLVSANLLKFRSEWGNEAVDVALPDDVPANFKCVAFSSCSLEREDAYRRYLKGNQVLRQYVEAVSQEDRRKEWMASWGLLRALDDYGLPGARLYDTYQCIREVLLSVGACIVLFSPGLNRCSATVIMKPRAEGFKPLTRLAVCKSYMAFHLKQRYSAMLARISNDIDGRERGRRMVEDVLRYGPVPCEKGMTVWEDYRKALLCADLAERRLQTCFNVLTWDGNQGLADLEAPPKRSGESYSGEISFMDAFLPDVAGTEPLPLPRGDQRLLVYGRKQLRKVRGGPGTGKSLTMLWHAVMAMERTGLPVLLLCKTHSLIAKNLKRLEATYINKHKNLKCFDKRMLSFQTLDSYLCRILKSNELCFMSTCGLCRRNCCMGKLHEEFRSEYCSEFHPDVYEVVCRPSFEDNAEGLSVSSRNRICNWCKDRAHKMLRDNKNYNLANLAVDAYAAVLVDETQILDMKDIELVYQITGAVNPWREFYIFFDEEQSDKKNSLVQQGGFKTVPAPDSGFGKPITLNVQRRTVSAELLAVF